MAYTEKQLKRQEELRDRRRKTHRELKRRTKRQWRLYERAKARLELMRKENREAVSTGQLSEHFNVREFDCKDGTKVPVVAIPALRRLCLEQLEPMRAKYGACTVHSGYRHRAYNASIGGAQFSQHIYDDGPGSVAADVSFPRGRPQDWSATARANGAGGVGTYTRSNFTHVDNGPRRDWTG